METAIRQYLDRAELLLKHGHYLLELPDGAVSAISRFYYAMFHATEALLYAHQIEARSHKGLISLFNQYFIKTNKLERNLSVILSTAFAQRQLTDYDVFVEISDEEIRSLEADARHFVNEINTYLREHRFLNE